MVLHPRQTKSVETSAMYRLPTTSSITSRKCVKVLPSNGTSFTQNQQITIELPAIGFLDNLNSCLSFDLSATTGETLLTNNSQCYIDRLRISTGRNEVLVDIMEYGKLNGILETIFSHQDYTGNVGGILEGTGELANAITPTLNAVAYDGNANPVVAGVAGWAKSKRCIQLLGGILDNSTYFPLKYTNGLIIDIFIASDTKTTCAGLTLSNVNYICEFLTMDGQYTANFENQFLTSGIKYSFDTYQTSQTNITTANFSKQIVENVRSLKSVYAVQQYADDKDNVFRKARVKMIQWKYGADYIPSQAVNAENGGAEPLKELVKAVNLSGDNSYDINMTPTDWDDSLSVQTAAAAYTITGKKFIIGQNFELSPSQSMSGVDATKKPLQVSMTYSANMGATEAKQPASDNAVTFTTFVHYDVIAVFSAQGTQVIY